MQQIEFILFENVPDPRDAATPNGKLCQICVSARSLHKIASKHAGKSAEPWAQWLPAPAMKALVVYGQNSPAPHFIDLQADAHLASAVECISRAVRKALCRPRVLRFCVTYQSGHELPGEKWILVLPSGAVAYVHAGKDRNNLNTCFYLTAARRELNPAKRWLRAVESIVDRHAIKAGGRYLLPRLESRFQQRDENADIKEYWHHRRFVTLTTWGFQHSAPAARIESQNNTNSVRTPKKRLAARVRLDETLNKAEVRHD